MGIAIPATLITANASGKIVDVSTPWAIDSHDSSSKASDYPLAPEPGASCKRDTKDLTEQNYRVAIDEWITYNDLKYGFSVSYPKMWDSYTSISQSNKPDIILKRQTFSGPGGTIFLDIWSNRGVGLDEWLKDHIEYDDADPTLFVPIIIAGQVGKIYNYIGETVDALTAFIPQEEFIVRIIYQVTDQQAGMDAFWKMLNSYRITKDQASTNITEIPKSIMDVSKELVARSNVITDRVATCCNHETPGGNPFPCCSDSSKGNCTWYVHHYYKKNLSITLGFYRDAKYWWDDAYGLGYTRTTTPQLNAIAWTDQGTYGHVAIVTAISQDTVTLLQMAICNPNCPYNSWPSKTSYKYIIP